MDLKKLDEALDEFAMFEADGPLDWHEKPVVEAARVYRDLLANGERVEPDYEAAARAIATVDDGSPLDELPGSLRRIYQEMARVAVDAAIGSAVLVKRPDA